MGNVMSLAGAISNCSEAVVKGLIAFRLLIKFGFITEILHNFDDKRDQNHYS